MNKLSIGRAAAGLLCCAVVGSCGRPTWTEAERSKGPHTIVFPPGLATDSPAPAPAPPAWAEALMGERLSAAAEREVSCRGNIDRLVRRYRGSPSGADLAGWGWYEGDGAGVSRVVLVDQALRIVGAGEGGRARPDVPKAVPEIHDPRTGWRAVSRAPGEVEAYGLVEGGRAICHLGRFVQ